MRPHLIARLFAAVLATASCAVAVPARAEIVDRIAAVVDDDLILLSEIDEVILASMPPNQPAPRENQLAALRPQALEQLIGEKLIESAMREAGITVQNAEIDAAITQIAGFNNITPERLLEEVARTGMSEPEYRVEVRRQLSMQRWRDMTISPRISIDEEDVRSAWMQATGVDAGSSAGGPERVRLSRIYLAFEGREQPEVEAQARLLVEELRGGRDFRQAALELSDDAATRERGGASGIFSEADLTGPIRDALEDAEQGYVSDPIAMGAGLMIIQLDERLSGDDASYQQARQQIFEQLYAEEEARQLEAWIEEARTRTFVEVRL